MNSEPLAPAGGQEETSHVTRGSEDSSVAPGVGSRAVSSACRGGGAFRGCECLGRAPSAAGHPATSERVCPCPCVRNDKLCVKVSLLSFHCSSHGKEQLSVLCS